jgi:hypothetical protein
MLYLSELVGEDNINICYGKRIIAEECFLSHNKNLYVVDDNFDVFSFSIGLAISNNNKVLVFVEDYLILRYLSSLVQTSISNCNNIIIFVLNTGKYSENLSHLTLSNSVKSMYSVLFNMGFFMYNFTQYFSNKTELKKVIGIYNNIVGPSIIFIEVDSNKIKGDLDRYKNLPDIKDIIKNGLYNIKE